MKPDFTKRITRTMAVELVKDFCQWNFKPSWTPYEVAEWWQVPAEYRGKVESAIRNLAEGRTKRFAPVIRKVGKKPGKTPTGTRRIQHYETISAKKQKPAFKKEPTHDELVFTLRRQRQFISKLTSDNIDLRNQVKALENRLRGLQSEVDALRENVCPPINEKKTLTAAEFKAITDQIPMII